MSQKEQLIDEIQDLKIQLENEGLSEKEFEIFSTMEVSDLENEKTKWKNKLILDFI